MALWWSWNYKVYLFLYKLSSEVCLFLNPLYIEYSTEYTYVREDNNQMKQVQTQQVHSCLQFKKKRQVFCFLLVFSWCFYSCFSCFKACKFSSNVLPCHVTRDFKNAMLYLLDFIASSIMLHYYLIVVATSCYFEKVSCEHYVYNVLEVWPRIWHQLVSATSVWSLLNKTSVGCKAVCSCVVDKVAADQNVRCDRVNVYSIAGRRFNVSVQFMRTDIVWGNGGYRCRRVVSAQRERATACRLAGELFVHWESTVYTDCK